MVLVHRRLLVAALAFLVALALLGRWVMRPDQHADAPSTDAQIASVGPASPQPTPEAIESASTSAGASAPAQPASASGALRGRVVDAVTRQPIREFELELQRGHAPPGVPAPGARAFRTQDGRFEWKDVQAGEWTLFANARGYQRFELANVRIATNSAGPELVVPLRSGYTLRGRVYDEATGLGVAAADISYRDADVGRFEGNWRSRARIVSGKDGSFVFDGLPPGRITLMVHAREYAGRELEVATTEDAPPIEIGLIAGGLIAGRLTAADGVTPVSGQAGLYRPDEGYGGIGQTGPSGEFRYEHLEPGRYRLVGRSGSARVEQEITLAPNQRMEGIVLALKPGSSIRGVVSGLRPEELKQVTISVRREDGGDHGFQDNAPDRNGAFEVQGVAPGRVHVAADLNMRRQVWKTIEMPANGDAFVELDFARGARLSGRVTRGGRPLAHTRVTPYPVIEQNTFSYGALTSAEGEYVVEGLANGEHRVRVEGFPSRFVHITGDTVFNIELPAADLLGRVLEDRGKAPIVGAEVELRHVQPGARSRWVDESDHLGQFALRGVEGDAFLLTVYRPGYDMFRERIAFGASSNPLTVRLRRGGGVEIRVRDAGSGTPLRRVHAAEAVGEDRLSSLWLELDEQGVGALPGALVGSTLAFGAEGYAEVLVRDWSGDQLDLRLARSQPE